MTFNQEAWDRIPWVRVHDDLMLPDVAKLVRDKLADPAGIDMELDAKLIGEQIIRQLHDDKEHPTGAASFRLSGSGGCLRRMAHDYHGTPPNGFEGDATARLVFAYGDAVEAMVVLALWAACRGPTGCVAVHADEMMDGQRTVTLKVGDLEIPGHPDGALRVWTWERGETPEQAWARNLKDGGVLAVLEVKSASDYGFKKFREHGLQPADSDGNPDGYYYQTQAYQLARRQAGEDVAWSYLIMFGKGTSAKHAEINPLFTPPNTKAGTPRKTYTVENPMMWRKSPGLVGAWVSRNEEVQDNILRRFASVVASSSPDDFQRIQNPEPGGKLSFPCDWCPHTRNCFPNAREVADKMGWFHAVTKITTLV